MVGLDKKKMYAVFIAVVVIVFAVLVYLNFVAPKGSSSIDSLIGQQVQQSVINEISVPSSLSSSIGLGNVAFFPIDVKAPLLMNGTKPEVLYIGADYCPYCAGTRWGLVLALQRFGNFSKLYYMTSNSSDIYPDTPTFSFANSTYYSPYISFVGVETSGRSPYQKLQNLTSLQAGIFSTLNSNQGAIPFIDFGNVTVQSSAPITPQALQGKTWNSIISNLTVTNSSVSQSVVGSANLFTAEICRITNFTPSSVCSQPYIGRILRSV